MKEAGNAVVLITTATEEEAHSIAELLLNQRRAACVNIVPRVNSLFRWRGWMARSKRRKECTTCGIIINLA